MFEVFDDEKQISQSENTVIVVRCLLFVTDKVLLL